MANFTFPFVEAPGNTLLASRYNAMFQTILDNFNPASMDDMSPNISAFRATLDPGEVASETLPVSLEQEIQTLRYAIGAIHGGAQWYDVPENATISPETPAEDPANPDSTDLSTENAIATFADEVGNLRNSQVSIDPETNNVTIGEKRLTISPPAADMTFTDSSASSASAWDLTAVSVGDIVVADNGSKAIVTSKSTDTLQMTGEWDGDTPTTATHTCYVRKANSSKLITPLEFTDAPVGSPFPIWGGTAVQDLYASYSNVVALDGQTISDVESIFHEVELPNMNDGNHYIGSATGTYDSVAKAGNTGNTINIQHTHNMGSHTHNAGEDSGLFALIKFMSNGSGQSGVSGLNDQSIVQRIWNTTIAWATNRSATVSGGRNYFAHGDAGDVAGGDGGETNFDVGNWATDVRGTTEGPSTNTTGTGLSTTQSIRPSTIRCKFYMRIK